MRKLRLDTETLRVLTQPAAPVQERRGTQEEVGSSRNFSVCGCTEPITN